MLYVYTFKSSFKKSKFNTETAKHFLNRNLGGLFKGLFWGEGIKLPSLSKPR